LDLQEEPLHDLGVIEPLGTSHLGLDLRVLTDLLNQFHEIVEDSDLLHPLKIELKLGDVGIELSHSLGADGDLDQRGIHFSGTGLHGFHHSKEGIFKALAVGSTCFESNGDVIELLFDDLFLGVVTSENRSGLIEFASSIEELKELTELFDSHGNIDVGLQFREEGKHFISHVLIED